MDNSSGSIALFALSVLSSAVGAADVTQQAEAQAARPAEYLPLQNFVGRWTTAGRERAFEETCEWYHGGFHVVCHSVSKRADGSTGHGMSILSHVPDAGYVYSGIGSKGRYETFSMGRWQDGQFVFDSPGSEGGSPVTNRINIGPFTDQGFEFVVSSSADGQSWTELGRTTYLRLDP